MATECDNGSVRSFDSEKRSTERFSVFVDRRLTPSFRTPFIGLERGSTAYILGILEVVVR